MKLIVVGCGLAGLSCGIAARKQGLEVLILERAAGISAVGAGIQIPPNATRIIQHLGLFEALLPHVVVVDYLDLKRYENGELLVHREIGRRSLELYSAPWCVAHREDYHRVLYNAALQLGIEIRLASVVKSIDSEATSVMLEDGQVFAADVIAGADGIWSKTRDQILGYPSAPIETGDLAYRAVFSSATLTGLGNPRVQELITRQTATLWMGPDKHCVLYPVRGGREWNMVLLRPDDLPPNTRTAAGDIDEMRATFQGWDEVLTAIVSCIPSVLKWKLLFHQELETWCKGSVVIIGDACHPTLPYQAQGAAMAVEDGAVLGYLLGKFSRSSAAEQAHLGLPAVLRLFESLRKKRTTLNVKGAEANRYMYHMHDGQEQIERDTDLKSHDGERKSRWQWIDLEYQQALLGFDVIADADRQYDNWLESRRA